MTDVPGEGFEAGAAYVQVSPEGEDFQEEVRAIVGETDIVVQVPVVPDAEDFRARLEEQVTAGDTAVQVPVVPDTAGFRLLLEDQLAGSGAQPVTVPVVPDTAGFQEKVAAEADAADKPVEVPVIPDVAGFTEKVDAEAEATGTEAGAAFSQTFTGAMSAAGEESAAAFREKFESVAGQMTLFTPGEAEAEAGAAGEAAGATWRERFAAAANTMPDLEGLAAAADAEAGAAGEAAGATFSERFAAVASRAAAFTGSAATFAGIGEEDGEAAGAGFIGRMKETVSGGMGSIEFLLGAGFVAATAVMANSFQEAMERIHTQAGVGQSSIKGLSNDVLNLAGKVGESPSGLAAALYHVESAFQSTGITGAHAMQILQIAAEGARTGGSDLVDTTNALDAIMVSGVGGFHSYAQAMGAVNAIVGAGDMTMQDFADAAGSGLFAVAKSYGQSLPEIGAALATFGDNNIRGAKAATDLRMAMQAIEAPVKTAAGSLAHLGLGMNSLSNEMVHHGLTAAIGDFIGHLKASHVPISEWGQYVTEIFGKRAGVGIGVLIDQYSRLQSKLGDITGATHRFGSAWAATEATTSQKLHNLESGLEALMIRIGRGLLPYLNDIFTAVSKALPSIEKWGAAFAKIASPTIRAFFSGLRTVFHMLLGPLKDITLAIVGGGGLLFAFNLLKAAFADNPWMLAAVGIAAAITIISKLHGPLKDAAIALAGLTAAFIAFDIAADANPFSLIVMGIGALIVLIIKFHKQILDALKDVVNWIKGHWVLVALLGGPLIDVIALVIKFHKQILDAFVDTWRDVEHAFDAFKSFVTGSFDSWWASHGQELEEVWKAAWKAVSQVVTTVWDDITATVSAAWQLVGPFLEAGLSLLEGGFKVTWDAISAYFKTAWDVMAAIVKIAWAGITSVIKIAWDLIVGIFDIALDLLTGHWGKAWDDMKTLVTQVGNAIREFLAATWNAISSLAVQVWNNIKSFLSSAWHDIEQTAVNVFNDIRHDIAAIWDGIVSDIESVVGHIESIISGIGHAITSVPGKILSGLGMAGGGIVPGRDTGRDNMLVAMRSGEGVLIPEAVRGLGGPGFVHAANAKFGGGRAGMAYGGVVPSFAGGGIAGALGAGQAAGRYASASGDSLETLITELVQMLSGQGQGARGGEGATVNMNYFGTSYPSIEQRQAMILELTSAVSNA